VFNALRLIFSIHLLVTAWGLTCQDLQSFLDSRCATAGGVVRLILGYQKSAATPSGYCAGIVDSSFVQAKNRTPIPETTVIGHGLIGHGD
jgi:hypothetical protein